MSRILIVEDDETLRGELSYFLIGNGYEVSVITDFKDTLDEMLKTDTELILLDLNLPGIDGQTLLRMYRKEKNTPVIIVTSKDTEMDELICMTYGADDFVSKPYNPALLLLHIEAVLRRNGGDENVIRYRDITLNLSKSSISGNGNEIELSKNECRILNYMFRNSGKIVSREKAEKAESLTSLRHRRRAKNRNTKRRPALRFSPHAPAGGRSLRRWGWRQGRPDRSRAGRGRAGCPRGPWRR